MAEAQLTPTGTTLGAEALARIAKAIDGPSMTFDLSTGVSVLEHVPPHQVVREAALALGFPASRKYAANATSGELFFVDYQGQGAAE